MALQTSHPAGRKPGGGQRGGRHAARRTLPWQRPAGRPVGPAEPDVVFDPAYTCPEVSVLRTALRHGDWESARAVLDRVDPGTRSMLVHDGGEQPGVERLLSDVLARDPDDSAAAAMLGAHLTIVAWNIRTRAPAAQVTREQFAGFHEHLCRAEQVLLAAAARRPDDSAVWARRLRTARGLQLGPSEVRRRYDRLARIDPHHLPGQRELLQSLCPKWGGTWEQTHGFARECMLAAAPGRPQALLVAEAHLERWVDADGGAAGRAYLTGATVRAELQEAAHRSVWHPDLPDDLARVEALSTFAMLFSEMGDDRAAAGLFAALGPRATPTPWDYLGEPVDVVRRRRARAARTARKR